MFTEARAGKANIGCIHVVLLCIFVCGLLFILTDRMLGKTVVETGTVIEKSTKTSTSRKNGHTKTTVTYYLDVNLASSGNVHQNVDKSDYESISKGDRVELTWTVGGITGSRYFKQVRRISLAERPLAAPGRR